MHRQSCPNDSNRIVKYCSSPLLLTRFPSTLSPLFTSNIMLAEFGTQLQSATGATIYCVPSKPETELLGGLKGNSSHCSDLVEYPYTCCRSELVCGKDRIVSSCPEVELVDGTCCWRGAHGKKPCPHVISCKMTIPTIKLY